MGAQTIDITVDAAILATVDAWVREGLYPDRSAAILAALRDKDTAWRRERLIAALKKLEKSEERKFSEEWFAGEDWPDY